ncbi:MAG: endolytic transglycosylase MltG [Patescibacteria group bacterium]
MKKIIFIVLLLAMVLAAILAGYFLADVFLADKSANSQSQSFVVKKGQGVNEISVNLHAAGLINNQFNFETYLWLLRREGKIQAGEYLLNPQMSLRELTNIITYGRATNEKILTILEGWNNQEIASYLVVSLWPEQDKEKYLADFNLAAQQNFDYQFLSSKPAAVDLEGYLFPDTYNFYASSTPEEVVNKMLSNFDQKLAVDLREEIQKQKKTIHQVVTLASIIEEEVRTEQDRRLVADIFLRRLAINMALQADSTVNYVTGKKMAAISYTDRDIDSPYNTYQNPGLPPGPICNPGLDSIKAVVYPITNDYWYFLTTPDGQVIYSKTLEQHNIAKAKYLK